MKQLDLNISDKENDLWTHVVTPTICEFRYLSFFCLRNAINNDIHPSRRLAYSSLLKYVPYRGVVK